MIVTIYREQSQNHRILPTNSMNHVNYKHNIIWFCTRLPYDVDLLRFVIFDIYSRNYEMHNHCNKFHWINYFCRNRTICNNVVCWMICTTTNKKTRSVTKEYSRCTPWIQPLNIPSAEIISSPFHPILLICRRLDGWTEMMETIAPTLLCFVILCIKREQKDCALHFKQV